MSRISCLSLAVVALTIAGLAASEAQAGLIAGQTVNVDLLPSQNVQDSDGRLNDVYADQGVLPSTGNTWNGVESPASGSITESSLLDSQGSSTTVGFNLAAPTGSWSHNKLSDFPNELLVNYASLERTDQSTANQATLTISGLTAGVLHDVAIYSQGDTAGQGGEFTLGSQTKTTSADPLTVNFDEGVNYITLSGQADSNGELQITWRNLVDGNGSVERWSALNGFQVQAVPEPASLALLGLGGLMMISGRRRKTR